MTVPSGFGVKHWVAVGAVVVVGAALYLMLVGSGSAAQ